MRTIVGDIWKIAEDGHWKMVVPTNIGWARNGCNVMGRGIAKQAALRFPELPEWYGRRCRRYGIYTPVTYWLGSNIYLFPVKPLVETEPWLSWKQPASLSLIERSCIELAKLQKANDHNIALPLVGCGNGHRKREEVLPILERHLLGDRFLLVEREE